MNKNVFKTVLRGALASLLLALIPLFLILAIPLIQGQYMSSAIVWPSIAGSLIFGVVIYIAGKFTRRLQSKVGTFTGLAGLAGATALVGTALMLAVPICPGTGTDEACTVPEASSFGLAMSMLVILFTVITMFVVTGKEFFHWSKKTAKSLREAKREKAEAEAEQAGTNTTAKGESPKEKTDAS